MIRNIFCPVLRVSTEDFLCGLYAGKKLLLKSFTKTFTNPKAPKGVQRRSACRVEGGFISALTRQGVQIILLWSLIQYCKVLKLENEKCLRWFIHFRFKRFHD